MYRVIGADQREYGPVSPENVQAWIVQGRLTASSLVQPEGTSGWKPLSDFPEFGSALAQAAAAGPSASITNPAPARTQNGLALASLILGCVSLVRYKPLAVVGLILGIVALGQTRSDPHKGERSLAIAGVAVSAAAVTLFGLLAGFSGFRHLVQKLFG
jgi:hypothetical protein